jgi:hypothetical protein
MEKTCSGVLFTPVRTVLLYGHSTSSPAQSVRGGNVGECRGGKRQAHLSPAKSKGHGKYCKDTASGRYPSAFELLNILGKKKRFFVLSS